MKEALIVALIHLIAQLEDMKNGAVPLPYISSEDVDGYQKSYIYDIEALTSLKEKFEKGTLFEEEFSVKRDFFKQGFFRVTYDHGYRYTDQFITDLDVFITQYREYLDSKGYLNAGD